MENKSAFTKSMRYFGKSILEEKLLEDFLNGSDWPASFCDL